MAARAWEYTQFSYLLFQVLWTVAIVVRLRRSGGDEARRMRWLAYPVVMNIAALAEELFVSPKTVEGYVRSVFTKLGLAPGERVHRRVLAVLQFLRQH